jgi:hypothetical protein
MAAETLETKAHELLNQLNPSALAAVVQLLEVIVHDSDPVTDEDRRRLREGQSWFAKRDGKGIPMEDVLKDFGLVPTDFPLNK